MANISLMCLTAMVVVGQMSLHCNAQEPPIPQKNQSATYMRAAEANDKIEEELSRGKWSEARSMLIAAKRRALSGLRAGDRDVAELLCTFDLNLGLIEQLVYGKSQLALEHYREVLDTSRIVDQAGGVWWDADDLRALALRWKLAAELGNKNPADAVADLQALTSLNEQRLLRSNRAFPTVERDLASKLGGSASGGQVGSLAVANLAVTLASNLHFRNEAANELALRTILRTKGRQLDRIGEGMKFFEEHSPAEFKQYMDFLSLQSQYAIDKWINKLQPRRLNNEIKRIEQTAETNKGAVSKLRISAQGVNPVPLTSEEITPVAVSKELPDQSVLVEIFAYRAFNPTATEHNGRPVWFAPKYAAFLLDSNGKIQASDLGETKRIDTFVDSFREDLHDTSAGSSIRETGANLTRLIWEPLSSKFQGKTHLFISPDGRLNLVPFAALYDADGSFLIQRYSIQYLASGRDLLRNTQPKGARGQPFIAVYPCFDTNSLCSSTPGNDICSQVSNLPKPPSSSLRQRSFDPVLDIFDTSNISQTKGEGCDLLRLFPHSTVVWGAAATESSIKSVNSPSILHIATHAYYIPSKLNDSDEDLLQDESIAEFRMKAESFTYPETWKGRFGPFLEDRTIELDPSVRSGIALAGANLHSSENGEDGILTALEMSALNLNSTELVVLSACETGLGDVVDRGGPSGLRRALAIAGAETEVISLWSVNDTTTRDLMHRFYAYLIGGVGRQEALRRAQLDLLNGSNPTTQAPYYWAPFIESGDWHPLSPDVIQQSHGSLQ